MKVMKLVGAIELSKLFTLNFDIWSYRLLSEGSNGYIKRTDSRNHW